MGIENRFTQKAQNAISLAQECANETGCSYVGTEHLLFGLFKVFLFFVMLDHLSNNCLFIYDCNS